MASRDRAANRSAERAARPTNRGPLSKCEWRDVRRVLKAQPDAGVHSVDGGPWGEGRLQLEKEDESCYGGDERGWVPCGVEEEREVPNVRARPFAKISLLVPGDRTCKSNSRVSTSCWVGRGKARVACLLAWLLEHGAYAHLACCLSSANVWCVARSSD